MPLIGAGASIPCGLPMAAVLADQISQKIDRHEIAVDRLPSDFARIRTDFGKVADLVTLDNPPNTILEEIGFDDTTRWPDSLEIAEAYDRSPHHCAYRVLARMAREKLTPESVTFNYDCHYEGGLRKEGFFPDTRGIRSGRWPELFTVVADATTHSSVLVRGDFVLNKVHGCVDAWRQQRVKDLVAASNAVVIRWTQLLDWRQDWWSRDLVRDRARRHVLLLIGFSALDPVIHSTLQAVLREVVDPGRRQAGRIRVIDTDPDQLSLQLLTQAGGGDIDDVVAITVPTGGSSGLAAVLLALLNELLAVRLNEYAMIRGADPRLPNIVRLRDLRLTVSGPTMLRWTWSILAKSEHGQYGLSGLTEKGDDYYVPLTADPERSLRAFEIRDTLASKYGLPREDDDQARQGGFLLAPSRGRAYMPLGLYEHEATVLAQRGILEDVAKDLKKPMWLERSVVTRTSGGLKAFSLENGLEVDL